MPNLKKKISFWKFLIFLGISDPGIFGEFSTVLTYELRSKQLLKISFDFIIFV